MANNVDFNSNPKKAFWQFTAPLLLLTLFEAGYSFVDVFWVSQMNLESFFVIVTLLAPIFKHGAYVMLGILIGEVTFGIAYYVLLMHILKKSENDIVHDKVEQ